MKNILENPVKSSSEMFEDLTELYENETQEQHLSDLVIKVEAKLQTTASEIERRKMLALKFHGDGYFLIANFSGVEKMRLRRTLVEHATEVVARIVDDMENLKIPQTLKEVVGEKIRDYEWVALL